MVRLAVKRADPVGCRCWRWLRRCGDCGFGSRCSEVPRIPIRTKASIRPSKMAGGAADVGLGSWLAHLLAGL